MSKKFDFWKGCYYGVQTFLVLMMILGLGGLLLAAFKDNMYVVFGILSGIIICVIAFFYGGYKK